MQSNNVICSFGSLKLYRNTIYEIKETTIATVHEYDKLSSCPGQSKWQLRKIFHYTSVLHPYIQISNDLLTLTATWFKSNIGANIFHSTNCQIGNLMIDSHINTSLNLEGLSVRKARFVARGPVSFDFSTQCKTLTKDFQSQQWTLIHLLLTLTKNKRLFLIF